jgi:hypothetical protein
VADEANRAVPPDPAAASGAPARRTRRSRVARRLKLLALLLLALAIALPALYVWLALGYSYASGERAGYVHKFSRRGWVCKTWEGELAMVSQPGALPEMFRFTVRDDGVAARINAQLGARVALSYEEHLALPGCFGETPYFVTGVRRVQP